MAVRAAKHGENVSIFRADLPGETPVVVALYVTSTGISENTRIPKRHRVVRLLYMWMFGAYCDFARSLEWFPGCLRYVGVVTETTGALCAACRPTLWSRDRLALCGGGFVLIESPTRCSDVSAAGGASCWAGTVKKYFALKNKCIMKF